MAWRPDIKSHSGPLYRAIADALARDVAQGALWPGEKLPPQRELARTLGVDLTTVTRAFAEATTAGLIVSEGRRGTFVRQRQGAMEADVPLGEAASGMNMPPESEDGALRQRMIEGVTALMKRSHAPFHYQPAGGTEGQRMAASSFLATLIPETTPDQVVVTAGGQQGLQAVLATIARPGDRVACSRYVYSGFIGAARRLGLELVPLPIDSNGILPDALEAEAAKAPLKALYVIPTNDNPTAATLPVARRKTIASLAGRHDFAIVEDDAYGRLPEKPLPPIATFAPDLSWHIVTMSKLLSPALRVGFVRAPDVRGALAVAGAAHDNAGMPPPINAALVARWLDDGSFNRLMTNVREEARRRMADAIAILAPHKPQFHADGYHLWLKLRPGIGADRLAAQAVAAGLPAVPSSVFAVGAETDGECLRITLGGSASRSRVKREIARIDAMLATDAPASTY